MAKTKILIIGAGSQARIIIDIFSSQGNKEKIIGCLDISDEGKLLGQTVDGIEVLGKAADLESFKSKDITSVIIGYGEAAIREEFFSRAEKIGWQFATAIHQSAIISSTATIGRGTVICAGAIVCTGVSIGDGVIINTNASIDHDCRIENFAHICPGSTLAGNVSIGARTWIGIGSSIVQGIHIGNDSLIGAGSVVLTNIPAHTKAFGSPAKIQTP